VEGFLRTFIPLFFMLDGSTFNAAFATFREVGESDLSDDIASGAEEESSSFGGNSKPGKNGRKGAQNGASNDLRKKLLKSEQAKAKTRKGRNGQGLDSSPVSRVPSPEPQTPSEGRIPRRSVFYCNTTLYVLLRLLEVRRIFLVTRWSERLIFVSFFIPGY
jgi:paired amphipathic helix protein Sin3a